MAEAVVSWSRLRSRIAMMTPWLSLIDMWDGTMPRALRRPTINSFRLTGRAPKLSRHERLR